MKYDFELPLNYLKEGHVLLCPTDTLWGLSCDATNAKAVNKILEIKKREADKGFILLVNSLDMLTKYVDAFPNFAVDIIEFSEQPLTIIFPKAVNLPKEAINDDGSVAIRLIKSSHEEANFCRELIRKLNKPIVSTSANYSGAPTPGIFSEIAETIKERVDYIVPNFQKNRTVKSASKIIKLNVDGTFKVLR